MTFRELYMLVLDKLELAEGDRRTDELVRKYINIAYVHISRFDHGVVEMELPMDQDSPIVYLPGNFISMKKVVHPEEGVLDRDSYKIINNRLILADRIDTSSGGDIKVMVALKPDELVNDDDVPEINQKYHIYLVYYALFLYTDEIYWLDLFDQGTGELRNKEEDLDDASQGDYVDDLYYGRG